MTEKQKDNAAKFLYDIAKPENFNIFAFVIGIIVSMLFFLLGQTLDKKEIK
jgi:hypothetical protein